MGKSQILIVKKEAGHTTDLQRQLEKLGYRVSTVVSTGEEALGHVGKIPLDLVLLPLHLQENMDGPKIAEHIRTQHRVAAIFLAEPADQAALDRAQITQPFGYLLAPYSERELQLTIEFALYNHQVEETLRSARDMLEEKIEELAASEQRYRTLVESPNLGVVLMDRRGRYLYVSPKMEEMTGYPPKAFYTDWRIGWQITHPDDHAIGEKAFITARNGTPIQHQEFRLLHRSGVHKWTSGSCFPVYGANGKVSAVQVIFQDIDEHKHLEAQLRQSQKMQAMGQLTAGIAHNFNNMLMIILGNLELAALDVSESQQPHLKIAESSALRAADMIRQLMMFSRQGVQPVNDLVEIDALLENTIDICQKTFDRKIHIPLNLQKPLPPIWGDVNQLEQVILNLCLNARDALEGVADSSPFISIHVDVVLIDATTGTIHPEASSGSYVRLRVSDDGVGMDEETRKRIFEPFFTTKDVDKGTGLGLSTAFGIIQQHRGWIECESEPGVGTTFSVYLPATDREWAAAESVEELETSPGTETILLIDDEEDVRRTVSPMLRRCGYAVLEAVDDLDGLEVFKRERENIDLVLLDLSMPRMSGREVLAELQSLDPEVKVALFTGHEVQKEEFAGLADIVHKPVLFDDLARTLRQILSP
jgi:two-component system cell cycle sensor histidine kinase/response regulator CckA